MWMLKRMRDMKDMLEAAPGMVAQAQQLGAQAQQMAVAQHAAYQTLAAQAAGARLRGAEAGADFDPIAGVPIEEFATVSRGSRHSVTTRPNCRKSRRREVFRRPPGRPRTRAGLTGSSGTAPSRSSSTSCTGLPDLGVFKSVRDLHKQAKEIERSMPPVGGRWPPRRRGSPTRAR